MSEDTTESIGAELRGDSQAPSREPVTQPEAAPAPAPSEASAAGSDATSAPAAEEAPKPKRRRRVTRRAMPEAEQVAGDAAEKDAKDKKGAGEKPADAAADTPAEPAPEPKPRARRGRRPKAKPQDVPAESTDTPSEVPADAAPSAAEAPVKRVSFAPVETQAPSEGDGAKAPAEAREAVSSSQPTASQQEAAAPDSVASGPADGSRDSAQAADAQQGEGSTRRRRNRDRRNRDQQQDGGQGGRAGQQQGKGNGPRGKGDKFDKNDRNNRRRNRKQNSPQEPLQPSLKVEDLQAMKVAELRSKAAELEVEYIGLRKAELVQAIYQAAAIAEGFRHVSGVLEIQKEGHGVVRTGNYMAGDNDAFVSQQTIRSMGLRPGDKLEGSMVPSRNNSKYPPMGVIEKVNGSVPDGLKSRPRFRDLTPIYPNERLVMENGRESITGRAIDLVAPIGKGQRGLIVSPPKAGKTTVLKRICQSITANNPEVHLFCLLVDERPEEVTDMERSIRGEVVASTFDMPPANHTAVAELVIEHAKRLVEAGEDVVVVLDSITRLARAYNIAAPASGRILSGGVDSAALYPPKKFLGAARNIENGGSLTILASALVDTGSKMDEVIFEEFKGTGNMELKLDRDLADKRIFPAIDPVSSGTRNEDLLIDVELQPLVWGIRRVLANMNNTERAANALVRGLKQTDNNQDFLIRSAKKAQQSDYIA